MKALRRLALALVVAVLALVLAEGVASVQLATAAAGQERVARTITHMRHDPELGWVNIPSFKAPNIYGPGMNLQTNAQGFRGHADVPEAKPAGTYRIVCLGDSFTMGFGVGDDACYPAILETLDPGIRTINMGLGGYGVGQCYLWYVREGVKYEADLLLFSVIAHDFYRLRTDVNVTESPRPQFALRDGKIVIVNAPLPDTTGEQEPWLDRLWEASSLHKAFGTKRKKGTGGLRQDAGEAGRDESRRVAEAMLTELRDLCAARGQRFVLAYLPTPGDLIGGREAMVDEWLLPVLERLGIEFVDVTPAFRSLTPSEIRAHFSCDNLHYSVMGNRLAARTLLDELRRLDPAVPR